MVSLLIIGSAVFGYHKMSYGMFGLFSHVLLRSVWAVGVDDAS